MSGPVTTLTTLQDLLDHAAIIDVVNRVALMADLRDWEAVRSCFADEVHLDYTSLAGGEPRRVPADEVVAGWRALLPGFTATQHIVANHQVALDGDRAICVSHFRAQHRIAEEGASDEIWELDGDYRHGLVRTPAGWRIAALRITWTFERGDRALVTRAAERARGADDHA